MKKIFFISMLLLLVATSCDNKKKPEENKTADVVLAQNLQESEGYKLMEQKCFICHFPVPDGSRRDEMIAPPMLRIQEHYKPAYAKQADFVAAIKSWVKDPLEDKVQMPGAVRRFKAMPYLPYTDEDVTLIAETLYKVDFGNVKGGNHGNQGNKQDLQLNEGKKWQLDDKAIIKVKTIIDKLDTFKSDDVKAYNQLGKDVFDTAKTLILDQKLVDEKFAQVQAFFHNVEDDIHQLMQVKTVEEGQKQQEIIKNKFSKFFDFFE